MEYFLKICFSFFKKKAAIKYRLIKFYKKQIALKGSKSIICVKNNKSPETPVEVMLLSFKISAKKLTLRRRFKH